MNDSTNGGLPPGWPGIPPRWTSSAKTGIGTALSGRSPLWFTLSHGIVNELYYPRIDRACIRDMGLIVTDDHAFRSEEKRDAAHRIEYLAAGIPAYRLSNRCNVGRYQIDKEIVTDPLRPALLQRTSFTALTGSRTDYHLFVVLAPHLANHGEGNTGWLGEYKGVEMLFAERAGSALALACSVPWRNRSVGYVGVSDSWKDIVANGAMNWSYPRAENGNIALAAEIGLAADSGDFTLAVAFGADAAEAGHRALATLEDGFDTACSGYMDRWTAWQAALTPLAGADPVDGMDMPRTSAMVIRTHEALSFSGGVIASLSIPWGFNKGDDDLGGYHLVWPRDLVEAAGGLLAIGALAEARRVLSYLEATQDEDGHWTQNMWLDGVPYWSGVQLDETALPILLVDLAFREGALTPVQRARFWPMVRRAAAYLVCHGPVSPQDRWEEDAGYSPFTVGAEIAALLVAADFADTQREPDVATYLRETADNWNAALDRWMYATDTEWTARFGINGYYVRVAPVSDDSHTSRFAENVPVHNVDADHANCAAWDLVSPDALALVRFGLRDGNDPRIASTVHLIDTFLKTEMPAGPAWHRYNGDGYGEHADGAPFDGTGIGRAWPLLTGERGHFELAAGRPAGARRLLDTLAAFANEGGMIPEQIWDAPDIPERELFFGRAAGSAMPLVWAHAEYLKLWRSLRDGRVFDLPPQPVQRYLQEHTGSEYAVWRFNHKIRAIAAGNTLRIETLAPATIHWSSDGWTTTQDASTRDLHLGIHIVDIPAESLPVGATIMFTLFWPDVDHWEGTDFTVAVVAARPSSRAGS